MPKSPIVTIVDASRRSALGIIFVALLTTIAGAWFVSGHFRINTDVNQLLSADLPWRKNEAALEQAFPQRVDNLLIVIDGETPDAAEEGADKLFKKLRENPDMFPYVERPDTIPFFRKNGLLFLSKDDLTNLLNGLVQAQPMLGALAGDPSLRGLFNTLQRMIQGYQQGMVDFQSLDKPFSAIAFTIQSALAGIDKPLPWQLIMSNDEPAPRDLRKLIIAKPKLDYSDLEPGRNASTLIRQIAKELYLTPDHGVQVRLTGSVALNDEEFASVSEGTGFATILSAVLVMVLLFMALRSLRLIVPIILTLIVGLVITTAVALIAIGSLNLISVAFAVMFIGIAVDFGIQFGVRYRDQHFKEKDHAKAMHNTALVIAAPLSMAAASTALGFLSFIPTDYRGVSELGFIAGAGMVIAFVLSITLLPAFLSFFDPPPEKEAIGFKWAAPFDDFIIKNRALILFLALAATIAGGLITTKLQFNFDPLDLKDPKTQSVATLFEMMQDPDFSIYTVEVLRPSLAEAQALAKAFEQLPEVDHAMTLASFVPEDQTEKLVLIKDTGMLLGPTLNPLSVQIAPTKEDVMSLFQQTSMQLRDVGQKQRSAQVLSEALGEVVQRHDFTIVQRLQVDLVGGILKRIEDLRESLKAEPVTIENISEDLRKDWITSDGRALVRVYPKGNVRNESTLIAFVDAVRRVAPDAGGSVISIRESGRTVTTAFMHAGCYALVTIMLMSLVVLRRPLDVIRLMLPLILAGILTLSTIVIIGLPLNFANIIALTVAS